MRRFGLLMLLTACATPASDLNMPGPHLLPVLLSTTGHHGLAHPPTTPTQEDPRVPTDLQALRDQKLGATIALPGETWLPLTEDGKPPFAEGAGARTLLRFVHLTDTQLVDDESPARQCAFDTPAATSGAFRPQEGYGCHLLDAAVQTVNALGPVDFVLTGGDNVDNAQRNELQWFGKILNGGTVECDSADDDGDKPGLPFPQKRPFHAKGLQVPWYWTSGNHDVLVTGEMQVDANQRAIATGTTALMGARDYRQPGAPVTTDEVPADAQRLPLYATETIAEVQAIADGPGPHLHGLAGLPAGATRIQYRVTPVPNVPVDLIVMDTNAHTGGSDGLVFAAVFLKEVQPLLDASLAAKHWAVVVGHHPTSGIGDGGGAFGHTQTGTLTPAQFRAALSKYPNVLFYLAGHTHTNHITLFPAQDGDAVRPFFEVQTASLADWPSQLRAVEVEDGDNGFLGVRLTMLDVPGQIAGVALNDLVAQALELLTIDRASGWNPNPAEGTAADRNVILWIKKPTGF